MLELTVWLPSLTLAGPGGKAPLGLPLLFSSWSIGRVQIRMISITEQLPGCHYYGAHSQRLPLSSQVAASGDPQPS
jgi:hypothetical protein